MIRFVYIGDQICDGEKSFAFYNTVYDKFVEFDGVQVFDDVRDFDEYSEGHELRDRCKAFIPKDIPLVSTC